MDDVDAIPHAPASFGASVIQTQAIDFFMSSNKNMALMLLPLPFQDIKEVPFEQMESTVTVYAPMQDQRLKVAYCNI